MPSHPESYVESASSPLDLKSHSEYAVEASNFFREKFNGDPAFVAVAPGRVNLIGEHVDHQGYSVLPAALNQSIQVAVGEGSPEGMIKIVHENQDIYNEVVLSTIEDLNCKIPQWYNYIIASLLGLFEYMATERSLEKVGTLVAIGGSPRGELCHTAETYLKSKLSIAVRGNASGVSSSSALTVAATVGISHNLNIHLTREELAAVCARAELHSGTAGGGMDQAAITLSTKGTARLVHFNPLTTQVVPLPLSGVLVVCNSGTAAPKAVSAATCYNKRVFEIKVACYIMLRKQRPQEEINKEKIPDLTLRYVQEHLSLSLSEAVELASKCLPSVPMGKKQIEDILGAEKLNYLLNYRVGPAVWERNVFFEPLRRTLHVYTEAQRVATFAAVCHNSKLDDEEKLKALGALLNESDESLKLLYDCSCPELNEITELALRSGAYGSRLTGAGWGGCTISLIHHNNVQDFLKKMEAYFMRQNRLVPINIPKDLSAALFTVFPGDGVSIFVGNSPSPKVWI